MDAKNNTNHSNANSPSSPPCKVLPPSCPLRSHLDHWRTDVLLRAHALARSFMFVLFEFCFGLKIFAQLAADFDPSSVVWSGGDQSDGTMSVFELRKPFPLFFWAILND